MKTFQQKDLFWVLPLALALGALLASLQSGSWFIGWFAFSFLFFLSFFLLSSLTRWAGGGLDTSVLDHRKTLAWMVALAFVLRFAGGLTTYLALPVFGHMGDEAQSAGFTYTDSYRRAA